MRVLHPAPALLAALVSSISCTPERQEWENTFTTEGEDLFVTDDDLVCLADATWTEVDGTRVTNLLGHEEEAIQVANDAAAEYPVGTVVQLFPEEVMVKRGAGFSADTGDWEFLKLHVGSGRTVITERGTTEIGNPGGSCLSCHAPARDFGF